MISITVIIALLYSTLIISLINGFNRIKSFKTNNLDSKVNFSIIIPFRNEAHNLPKLFRSLATLDYPKDKMEILLINDDSTDKFNPIIIEFKRQNTDLNLQLLNNVQKSNSPKKDAIELAIKHAKFEWIVSTDADCILPKKWLRSFDEFISITSPKMIVAPVCYNIQQNFLEQFQDLEFLSLQGSTIGGFGINRPFLCNGANLCYNKNAFNKVGGFNGNKNLASGDDIFLLEKMVNKFPNQVNYLKSKESIVKTHPEKSIGGLIDQRIRWASKTSSYKNKFGQITGLTVFLTNLYFIILFILAILEKISWQHFGMFFLLKFNIDFLLLYTSSIFFEQQKSLKSYFISSLIYPLFSVMVSFISIKNTYQWKGRSLN